MLLDLSPWSLIYIAAAVLAGGFVKGYSGFGASMFWVTTLSLVLEPREVVPIVLLFEVASSVARRRLLPVGGWTFAVLEAFITLREALLPPRARHLMPPSIRLGLSWTESYAVRPGESRRDGPGHHQR